MNAITKWLFSLLATIAAIAVSYMWLDRPVALLTHSEAAHRAIFAKLTHIPDPFLPAAVIIFVGVGIASLSGLVQTKPLAAALICSISLIVAEATKTQLKFVFGRYWPETWVQDSPSFIRDGVYGFNFLHGGVAYASFPSGYTAVTCPVVSVLWLWYPQLRPLYAMVVLGVAVGLVGANNHFLSDVIAGAFVGASTGWMTAALWPRADCRRTRLKAHRDRAG
jgi:membrane-associated phospholipid phosphatase